MMRRGIKWSVAVGSLAVGLWFYTRPDPITKLKVHGTWDPQFQQVADQFRKNLHSGMMRGGSFAAYVDGKPVVRLWGGYADDEFQLEWKENTLNTVVSFSKLTSAITFNTLVDKGLVNYDDLVSKHWPEFAQNGKEHVTVRELISHQAGLYALDTPISYREVISNPAKVEKILAEQKPAWEPGTAVGYHILTIGLYYDFLTRKIDPKHRPIYQIYEEEIRKPLGLDLYIGTPYAEQYRMARASQPTFRDTLRDFLNNPSFRRVIWSEIFGNKWSKKSLVSVPQVEVDTYFCDPELRALPIPSIGGVATASDAARLFGLVAARKPAIDGKPILSEKAVTALNTVVRTGEELQFKFNVSVGHGTLMWKNPRGENVFGHPAAGGQMGYCDPTNKVGLAFVTNDWGTFATNDDIRFVLLEKAFYNCLGKKK